MRARGGAGWQQLVEGAASSLRLGLRRDEQLALWHLDHRDEQRLTAAGEPKGELDQRPLALGIGDDRDDLHLAPFFALFSASLMLSPRG